MGRIFDYLDGLCWEHQMKKIEKRIEDDLRYSELEEEYQRSVGNWDEMNLVEKFMLNWRRYYK